MQALYESWYISHIMPVFVPHNKYACSMRTECLMSKTENKTHYELFDLQAST
jgi:hypothetical protein